MDPLRDAEDRCRPRRGGQHVTRLVVEPLDHAAEGGRVLEHGNHGGSVVDGVTGRLETQVVGDLGHGGSRLVRDQRGGRTAQPGRVLSCHGAHRRHRGEPVLVAPDQRGGPQAGQRSGECIGRRMAQHG